MISPPFSNKEINRKRQVMSPLNIGSSFIGIFTRRSVTKSGFPRFYVYTLDQNDLVIASELHYYRDLCHRISLSSTNFELNDRYSIGQLKRKEFSPSFIGKLNHFTDNSRNEDSIQIRVGRKFEKETDNFKEIDITILPHSPNQIEDDFSIVQRPFTSFSKLFPDVKFIESKKNVLFMVKKSHCFSLAKQYEDEFHFTVSYPLSIFQGFCIAISLFQKVKHE